MRLIRKHLHKFETMFWLFVKIVLYLLLMFIFLAVLGRQNIGLTRPSRMMGITITTFLVLEFLFAAIYGRYDVGRLKSKPIIHTMIMGIACTDVVAYLQVMIMRTNAPEVRGFRFDSLGLLVIAFLIQCLVITVFVYAGNELFFIFHQPEACCIITSSQESLDRIAFAVGRYRKQYKVVRVLNFRDRMVCEKLDGIDSVFIYDVPSVVRSEIMRYCYRHRINVYFNPDVEDIMELSAEEYMMEDIYLVNKNVKSLTMEQRIAKRLMDIVLSLLLLVITSPLWIGGMIAIKLDDGGPVFFTQERATIHGKRFKMYKLRTMRVNNENHSATSDDERITKPGHFLRRTRIDELPQLLNILKGDMTFVGPRPEMLKNVEDYERQIPEFRYRLRVKAGLTGYAQIHGKYNTSPRDKLAMDMLYIEKFSILHDIQLIFQTVIVLFKSDSTEGFAKTKEHCGFTFPEKVD